MANESGGKPQEPEAVVVAAAGEPSSRPTRAPAIPEHGRAFLCQRCGADVVFHIGLQTLRCNSCGWEQEIGAAAATPIGARDLKEALRQDEERRDGAQQWARQAHQVRCATCAAAIAFEGTLTASQCPYCGVPLQRDTVHQADNRVVVDGLLTFTVEETQAQAACAEWVRGRWLAPHGFKALAVGRGLKAVYLPFYSFDATTEASYTGDRGRAAWEWVSLGAYSVPLPRTSWTSSFGRINRVFADLLVPAITALPVDTLQALEPWPLERCVPFTPEALAGKLAHTYDVDLASAFSQGKARMEQLLQEQARGEIGGKTQRIEALETTYTGLKYKHLMLPVWLRSIRVGNKSYRIVVNACTGAVYGERPYSAAKVAAAALVAAGALLGMGILFTLFGFG